MILYHWTPRKNASSIAACGLLTSYSRRLSSSIAAATIDTLTAYRGLVGMAHDVYVDELALVIINITEGRFGHSIGGMGFEIYDDIPAERLTVILPPGVLIKLGRLARQKGWPRRPRRHPRIGRPAHNNQPEAR